jgi:hypothetical protein
MDEDRRIRFLIPPVLFVASLLWGAWLDGQRWSAFVAAMGSDWSAIIGIVTGGGVVVIAGGYILGTITYCALRFGFFWCGKLQHGSQYHEAGLSKEVLVAVWKALKLEPPSDEKLREDELGGVVAFDHGPRENWEAVHLWLVRRWTAFNIACNSVAGLLLSLLVGRLAFHIRPNLSWLIPVCIFILILIGTACVARWDGGKMLGFLAGLPTDILHRI